MIPRPSKRRAGPPGTCWVVRLSGEADLATAADLARALEQVPEHAGTTVVDLREVTFMDCSALPVLLRARDRHGGDLVLLGPQAAVRLLLEGTGLATQFVIQDADAGAGLERHPGTRVHLGVPAVEPPVGLPVEPAVDATVDATAGPTAGAAVLPPPAAVVLPGPAPVPVWSPPAAALIERAVGLLMGTHRCGPEQARTLLTAAATAHGVCQLDLAVALTAAAERREEYRCTPAALAALIEVMRPDRRATGTPGPDGVLPMVRQRVRPPDGPPRRRT